MGRSSLQKNKRRLRISNLAYYSCDQTAGASKALTDSSVNANTTDATATISATGKLGSGYLSGGTPTVTGKSIAFVNGGISCWFQALSAGGTTLTPFLKLIGAGGDFIDLSISTGSGIATLRGQGLNGASVNSSALTLSTWYHAAVTTEGGLLYVYLNGSLLGTTDAVDGDNGTITGWAITPGSNIIVDEMGFWSKVLSVAEVQYMYQAGIGFNPYSESA